MQRGFDGVFRAAVGVAGGGDLNVVAREEVHGDPADVLAGVIGDWDGLGVAAFLSGNVVPPSKIFFSVMKARETFRTSYSRLPINTHSHPRPPALRRHITAPATAALIRPNNVDPRAPIYAEMVDGPVGMVDGFQGASLRGSWKPEGRPYTKHEDEA